ncbi:site-specific integrase [Candidatus Poribacteria bacterium]|nr:site-specific integrase [Candidatus Poribacteria bacterium]
MRKPTGTRQHIRLLNHRRTSGLFLRDGRYIADIKPDDGRRVTRQLGTNRESAEERFEALLVELDAVSADAESPRLADFLLSAFLPTQRGLKSYDSSQHTVGGVVRFLDAKEADLRVRDVGPQHVGRLRAFYAEQGHKPRTINMFTQKLKQGLNHAVDLGLLDANPIARVKLERVDNRRVKFLALDDFTRLLEGASSTDAHGLFLTIGLTGLRPSNVRLLTGDEVDGDMIRIPPEKMKGGRWGEVPVSTFAQNLLAGHEPNPLYFPACGHLDRPKGLRNVQRAFASSAGRAGLEWATLYDLRHFFASQLAKHGATETQIGKLLCHVGTSVTSRYVHHDIEDLRPLVDEHGERVRVALGGPPALAAAEEDEDAIRV